MQKGKKKTGKKNNPKASQVAEVGQQRNELDKITKLLARRDFELSVIRNKREEELREFQTRTQELENARKALMNILEDIETARDKAEEEKNKTATIITNLADGLLAFDRENRLFLVNSQAERIFNIGLKTMIGMEISELEELSRFRPLINLLRTESPEIFRKELTLKEDLILEVSSVPMVNQGNNIGTMVVLHDITREKMIEKMKTEFVSLAAHQLRTPLAAIKWTLRMLLDGDLGNVTQEQRDFLDKTYQSNERMINLINSLLDVTRIEEGRYLYKPTFSDFASTVQFVVHSYQDEIKRKGISLEFAKPEAKLPKVEIDVEKMRLAIQNLIDNALKYTHRGGKIKIALRYSGHEIEFQIQDTGVGIPKDQQDRVFSKFFRGANVVRMETEGTGLGIFIVKNIIEAHGGRVWFESEEGQGTTFHFAIPVKKEFEDFLREF